MLGSDTSGNLFPDHGGQVARLDLTPRAKFIDRVREGLFAKGKTLTDLANFRLA